VNNLFSDANSLFGGLTTDVNGLLGSIENQLEARSKRGLFLSKTQLNAAGLLTDLSSAADVKAVLDSAGLEAGDERLGSLLGELGGNNVDEVIEDASNTVCLHLQFGVSAVLLSVDNLTPLSDHGTIS